MKQAPKVPQMYALAHMADLPSDYERAMADKALERRKKYGEKRRHGGVRVLTEERGILTASDGTRYVRRKAYSASGRRPLVRIGRKP